MRYRAIALSCVSVLVLGLCYAGGDERLAPQAGEKGIEAAAIRHGEYLVTEVAHCGHCHTPQNDKGLPIASRQLQGATLQIMPKKKTAEWADQSPDITRSGLAGKWSEQDMVKFLMTGVNPDGKKPIPPMPVFHLQRDDARAVTMYLRSLPGKRE